MGSTKYNKREKRVTASRALVFFIILGVFGLLFWWTQLQKQGVLFEQGTPVELARAEIRYDQLPEQARTVYQLILAGGSFAHEQDGSVFGNYERQLPVQPRGYYHEYTVRTPGVSHRGARRIVCGGRERRRPQACYYTQDHYKSFQQIIEVPVLQGSY